MLSRISFILFLATVDAACPEGQCAEMTRGCVESTFGTLCDECGNQGWLNGNECECYGTNKDPAQRCAVPLLINSTIDIVYSKTNASCDTCPFDDARGYMKSSGGKHKFGDPDPPVCDLCWTEAFGPKPGQAFERCNKYGSPDPNALYSARRDDSWRECGNHGTWMGFTQGCVCDEEWKLAPLVGVEGRSPSETVYTCTVCGDGFGPPVEPNRFSPPFCAGIYSIDPVDGVQKICSGHGVYKDGGCSCFYNATHGHWILDEVDGLLTCAKLNTTVVM